jgi:hypothetical protein
MTSMDILKGGGSHKRIDVDYALLSAWKEQGATDAELRSEIIQSSAIFFRNPAIRITSFHVEPAGVMPCEHNDVTVDAIATYCGETGYRDIEYVSICRRCGLQMEEAA